MIGLESCFGAVNKVLVKQNGMSLKSLIEKLTVNPRKVMNLEQDLFSIGVKHKSLFLIRMKNGYLPMNIFYQNHLTLHF